MLNKEKIKEISKRGTAIFLAGTLVCIITTGCNKKESLFEDTILEEAQVMEYDDNVFVVVPTQTKQTGYSRLCRNKHYKDIVTGTIYHVLRYSTKSAEKRIKENKYGRYQSLDEFKNDNSCLNYNSIDVFSDEIKLDILTKYMTLEEIKKANSGEFTDEDAIILTKRIVDSKK